MFQKAGMTQLACARRMSSSYPRTFLNLGGQSEPSVRDYARERLSDGMLVGVWGQVRQQRRVAVLNEFAFEWTQIQLQPQ